MMFLQLATCQYPVTPAMIKGRAEVLGKTYDWYQQIDAAYFALYLKAKDTIAGAYSPYTNLQRDFTAAYQSVDLASLNEVTATNFSNNYATVKQALESTQSFSTQNSLNGFGSSMLSDLTYPANSFKMLTSSPMSSLFGYLTMQMVPLSETCIASILSKVNPMLEPYANYYTDLSTQTMNNIPTLFTSASNSIKKVIDNVNALTQRIKVCAAALTGANACINQIVSKFISSLALFIMKFLLSTEYRLWMRYLYIHFGSLSANVGVVNVWNEFKLNVL